MDRITYQRETVLEFANSMEAKLRTLDEERGEAGWLNDACSIYFLIERLEEELQELRCAFENCDSEAVMQETFDVANFAMMIHSSLMKQLRSKP